MKELDVDVSPPALVWNPFFSWLEPDRQTDRQTDEQKATPKEGPQNGLPQSDSQGQGMSQNGL